MSSARVACSLALCPEQPLARLWPELLKLADRGAQTVDIGGQALAAQTFVASGPDGVERQVWVDADGRVLKVVVAAQGLIALRDDPPPKPEAGH